MDLDHAVSIGGPFLVRNDLELARDHHRVRGEAQGHTGMPAIGPVVLRGPRARRAGEGLRYADQESTNHRFHRFAKTFDMSIRQA